MENSNALQKPFNSGSKIFSVDLEARLPFAAQFRRDSSTELVFDLARTGAKFKDPLADLTISVAQAYPDRSHAQVKGMAQSLKVVKKIAEKDCILRTSSSMVQEIGIVTRKKTDALQQQITLNIAWVAEVSSERFKVFQDNDIPLQMLRTNSVYGINGSGGKSLEHHLSGMGLALADEMTGTRIDYSQELEFFQEEIPAKEEKGGIAEIFFATNRVKTDNGVRTYGNEIGDELIYGTCEVSIPRGHVQGNLERPNKILFIEFPEMEGKHVVLKNVIELDETGFNDKLSTWVSGSEQKAALLFIHGFNTSFEEAARRTGQLAWDIPFDGPAGFFSWPSSGQLLSYGADEEKSETSAIDFSKFLMQILEKTGVEQLHILAHSMGSRVLAFSLNTLSTSASFLARAHVIRQVVLGAPDIDQEKFKKVILPSFKTIGASRTLYSSDKDFAMMFSHTLRGRRPRLGEAGASIFVEDGLDTVEVSNMSSGGINHNYIFEVKELLIDLFYLLKKGMTPADRRLKAVAKGKLRYWLFVK